MNSIKLTIQAHIAADAKKVWHCYTDPSHITQWNFADPSWFCPYAENDLKPGGKYLARMEAKDGSFGFDFEARYTDVEEGKKLAYVMTDDRTATVLFNAQGDYTEVLVTFDAETENPIELQQNGWQAILNNFKQYTESL